MTVRGDPPKPRRETGTRSPEALRRTRAQYREGLPTGLSQQRIGNCSRSVMNNAAKDTPQAELRDYR